MTLVMAEKDQPVFRDFLGLGRVDDVKQAEFISSDVLRVSRTSPGFDSEGDAETTATRGSSGTSGRFETCSAPGHLSPPFGLALPSSSDPGSVGWQRAKAASLHHHGIKSAFYKPDVDSPKVPQKRESPTGRESLQDRLVEALESSRPHKVARYDRHRHEKRAEFGELPPSADDLRLSMQPPRASNKSPTWVHQNSKHEPHNRHSKKLEISRPSQSNTGLSMRGLSHLGACAERAERAERAEKASAAVSRENNNLGNPQLARPAADEGSRTGLKGSPLAGLLNSAGLLHNPATPTPAGSSGGPPLTPRRPKMSSRSGGSDSMLPSSRKAPPPASRQLTIFYGGQAHVFDDVPPDKADAIMALAGSNGRSWSTTYSPRPTPSAPNSASEGSLSALERERDKTVQSQGGSLSLSTEVQTLLRGLAQSGIGSGRTM